MTGPSEAEGSFSAAKAGAKRSAHKKATRTTECMQPTLPHVLKLVYRHSFLDPIDSETLRLDGGIAQLLPQGPSVDTATDERRCDYGRLFQDRCPARAQ